jgi:hypothetical protein
LRSSCLLLSGFFENVSGFLSKAMSIIQVVPTGALSTTVPRPMDNDLSIRNARFFRGFFNCRKSKAFSEKAKSISVIPNEQTAIDSLLVYFFLLNSHSLRWHDPNQVNGSRTYILLSAGYIRLPAAHYSLYAFNIALRQRTVNTVFARFTQFSHK